MTASEFWDSDSLLARAYRKAYQLKLDAQDQYAWIQGMYVYEAICDASPLLHAFAQKGTKAIPFAEKPYGMSIDEKKRKEKAEKHKRKESNKNTSDMEQQQKAIAVMQVMALGINQLKNKQNKKKAKQSQ